MATDLRNTASTELLNGNQLVPIGELPARRRQLKKRTISGLQKFAIAGWELASVLAEAQEVFAPYRGEFRSFLDEIGISSSQGFGLVKAFRRSQELPPEALKQFSGPTSIMCLGSSDQALCVAKKRAEAGERITCDVAKEIAAKVSSKQQSKVTAVKVTCEIATIVIHSRKHADISALQLAIEKLIDRFAKEGGDA